MGKVGCREQESVCVKKQFIQIEAYNEIVDPQLSSRMHRKWQGESNAHIACGLKKPLAR